MAKGRQKSNHRWQREKIFPTHPLEVGVQLKSAMKYYAMTVFRPGFIKKILGNQFIIEMASSNDDGILKLTSFVSIFLFF